MGSGNKQWVRYKLWAYHDERTLDDLDWLLEFVWVILYNDMPLKVIILGYVVLVVVGDGDDESLCLC